MSIKGKILIAFLCLALLPGAIVELVLLLATEEAISLARRAGIIALAGQGLIILIFGYLLLEAVLFRPLRLLRQSIQGLVKERPLAGEMAGAFKAELKELAFALLELEKSSQSARQQAYVERCRLEHKLKQQTASLCEKSQQIEQSKKGMMAMLADLNELNQNLKRSQQELEGTNRDLLKQRRLLMRQQQIQKAYGELVAGLNSIDLDRIVDHGLRMVMEATNAQAGLLYLWDGEKQGLFFKIGYHLGERITSPGPLQKREELPLKVARLRRTISIKAMPEDAHFLLSTGFGNLASKEILGAPVLFHEELIGVLVLASLGDFSSEGLKFLQAAALQLGVAVNNARTLQKAQEQAQCLEKINQELNQASQVKSRFLATVSHELRTPLNSVIGFAQLLLNGGVTSEQENYLERILRNGKSLLKLIDDMLHLSQIEAGGIKIKLASVEVRELISSTAKEIESQTTDKGLSLSWQVQEGVDEIVTDQQRVRQILNNLLSNAIKFTPTGGSILLSAEVIDTEIALTVTDTGIGIEEDALEDIFVEFGDWYSPRPKGAGAGLGLAISRKLARLLGGDLKAKSILGQGSTFTLLLPLSQVCPPLSEDGEPFRQMVHHEYGSP